MLACSANPWAPVWANGQNIIFWTVLVLYFLGLYFIREVHEDLWILRVKHDSIWLHIEIFNSLNFFEYIHSLRLGPHVIFKFVVADLAAALAVLKQTLAEYSVVVFYLKDVSVIHIGLEVVTFCLEYDSAVQFSYMGLLELFIIDQTAAAADSAVIVEQIIFFPRVPLDIMFLKQFYIFLTLDFPL